jgi:hypothetical protein
MNDDKMDFLLKCVLVFTVLYFFFHVAAAFANPQSPPPIIRCIPGGSGTVTCFPI